MQSLICSTASLESYRRLSYAAYFLLVAYYLDRYLHPFGGKATDAELNQ